MLKSNWSSSTIAQSREEREGRRRRVFFLVVRQEKSEDEFDGSADFYVPTDTCRSLMLSRSHLSSLSYDNPRQPISPSPPILSRYPRKLSPPILTEKGTLSVPYLLTASHDPHDGVAPRLAHLAKPFHEFERLLHPIPPQRWPTSAELASARG
jgi:hypothetical protein